MLPQPPDTGNAG